MRNIKLNVRLVEIGCVLIALFIAEIASGNSTGPLPPRVTDIATQRKHITEGLRGNGACETVCRYPRNYFPFIQTPEGQVLLNKELTKQLTDGNWWESKSHIGTAIVAFVALRGDEDWYVRFSTLCATMRDNPVGRESIVDAVGAARTERAKRFVSEQLDIAYAEAIESVHGPGENLGDFIYLGRIGRILLRFDQPDTSARVDEMISKLRNALPGPKYEKRVLECELAAHSCFIREDIARYMEVRNLPRAEATAAIGGQANVTGDESHNPIPANTSDNDTAITWFAGIAAGLAACALFVLKKRRGAG